MLKYDEPLQLHTSWQVGGPARLYFVPRSEQDLAQFLHDHSNLPLFWLGLGSNVLIRDGGFNGAVISLKQGLQAWQFLDEHRLWVQAGLSCPKLARLAARAGLCGLAFLSGIPGTVGGALAMNAGAFGSEIWSWVESVQTIDHQGQIRQRLPKDYQIAYREVIGAPQEWFISAVFRLPQGDVAAEKKRIQALLKQRKQKQPIGQPSAGSTFRNPPGDYAARLIEACGLKGYRYGRAQVSAKHANFIINTGGARAQEIENLIQFIQNRVQDETGIRLQTEVHMIGEYL